MKEIMEYAMKNNSKLQVETYDLTKENLDMLLDVLKEIETQIPDPTTNITIRNVKKFNVDVYMKALQEILLSETGDVANYKVFVVVNFTWERSLHNMTIGLMQLWVSYHSIENKQGSKIVSIRKYVSSDDNIILDDILPEKGLILIRKYAFSREIMSKDVPILHEKFGLLFKDDRIHPKILNEINAMVDTKNADTRVYINLAVYAKREEENDYLILRMVLAYDTRMHHYQLRTGIENERLVASITEKLVQSAKNPIQKLRSFASKKGLPFFEKTYYVPEEVILHLYTDFKNVLWNDIGWFIYDLKNELDTLPPFSGVFMIQFAMCIQDAKFHMSLYVPYLKISIETYIMVLEEYFEKRKREYFPDDAYVTTVRRHALNPNLPFKQEDAFLEPYVKDMRYNIVVQNVRIPTNKSVPPHLKQEIEKWRKHYKKNLVQHAGKHKHDIKKLQLHKSYLQDIESSLRQKQRQVSIRQYTQINPTQQIPSSHPFKQEIQKERQRIKRVLDEYETTDDMVEKIWTDLNLVDPISSTYIKNPVRSPFVATGIYQQKNLNEWLSKSSLKLDPLSRKGMPTTFEPKVDQKVKSLIQNVQGKIQTILSKEDTDDFRKKLDLWKLSQTLDKDKVFQHVIRSKREQA